LREKVCRELEKLGADAEGELGGGEGGAEIGEAEMNG